MTTESSDSLSIFQKIWFFTKYTFVQFGQNRCILNAAALSYDTLLTIVPFLAISFSILSSFHLLSETQDTLFNYVSSQNFLHSDLNVTYYLKEFIENTKELDVLSFLFLLVSTLLLFTTIEKSLNIIWNSLNRRSFLQRFLSFWSIITFGPLLLGVGIHLSTSFVNEMSAYTSCLQGSTFNLLSLAMSFCLLLFFLTLLYLIVPTYRVRFLHALSGALFAALAIEFFRHAFVSYIMFIPSYQIIYKTLAAVPLLIIWLYIFWIFVLYGAQIAACLPDWRRLKKCTSSAEPTQVESLENAIALLSLLYKHSASSESSPKEFDLALYMGLPSPQLERLLFALQKSQLIEESASGQWFLVKDPKDILLYDIFKSLSLGMSHLNGAPSKTTSIQKNLHPLLKTLSHTELETLSPSLFDFLEKSPPC